VQRLQLRRALQEPVDEADSASIFLSSSNNFVVVFQLRMVMDLYCGVAMILFSRLLVRCALRRCE
jgi:hypothetical protein